MKRIMMPVMKRAPKFLGMAAPTEIAAARYLEALDWPTEVTGRFYASAPKKMTGPIEPMQQAHIVDAANREAAWAATVDVAGIDVPAAV